MKELINMHTQPLTLEDGTILAAAGTDGSVRHVESISDADARRLADRGLIAVRDVEFESKPKVAPVSEAPTESASDDSLAGKKEAKR